MKYISFTVPSYNSEKWLNKCIDSLLVGGDDVEIIIVNDGSKDNTINIANDYKEKYPTIVKVVDKENGGHGSGLQAGIAQATGLYFKCVDSDDWVDKDAFLALLEQMKKHESEGSLPDLYITNFVYENLAENKQEKYSYKKLIKLNQMLTFKGLRRLQVHNYLMMHSLTFKLDVVKKANIEFPLHTFYVDNLFVYKSLFYVNTIYQMDIDFYRYYVGRPNQSVTYENMTKNYAHQLRVIKEMACAYSLDEIKSLGRFHRKIMLNDLVAKLYLTYFYVFAKETKEKKNSYKDFLNVFKEHNPLLYKKIRFRSIYSFSFLLPGKIRKAAIDLGYKIIMKKTNWN